jgi:Na+/H+ antiporter
VQEIELLVLLLAIIGIVGALSQKFRISLPIALVLVGMMISLVSKVAPVRLEPDTVFFIFLPPLLYLDAFNTSWKDLKAVGDLIFLQAFGLVLITVVGVAVAIHAVIPGMPWAAAFVLGAIVSPTDAVVASAITKEVVLPKRVIDIIKGESLVNDATGLVAYQFAVAATVTGTFSYSAAGMRFIYLGFGGVVVGLIIGWILSTLRTKLDDKPVEIIGSLLSPFIVYLIAEHLHVSGVLSVVVAGLLLGWHGPKMLSSQIRLHTRANWETISYILNGFSFLLMGLQLKSILQTVKAYPAYDLFIWAATAAFAPIFIRFVWTFAIAPIYATVRRRALPHWKHLFVISWSGMRGIVSMAAALALPMTCADGMAFPYRDLIIFLTVVVIASTLLLQGFALPAIVRYFGLAPDLYEKHNTERETRLYISREALRTIDAFARKNKLDLSNPKLQKIIDHYLDKTINSIRAEYQPPDAEDSLRNLQAEAIKAQRLVLIKMRDNYKISEDLFQAIQNELDLEETQINATSTV